MCGIHLPVFSSDMVCRVVTNVTHHPIRASIRGWAGNFRPAPTHRPYGMGCTKRSLMGIGDRLKRSEECGISYRPKQAHPLAVLPGGAIGVLRERLVGASDSGMPLVLCSAGYSSLTMPFLKQ